MSERNGTLAPIVSNSDESEVARLLECCICHSTLEASHLCPSCSQPFCGTCIEEWLTKGNESCPCCRGHLDASKLIKAHTFDQMQEVIGRFISRNRCDKHKTEKLSMFCLPCEQTICADCWFSENHIEHKDQAVPIAVAFGQYRKDLESELLWIDERYSNVNQALDHVKENEDRLTKQEARLIKKIKQVEATISERLQQELEAQQATKSSLEAQEQQTLELRDKITSSLRDVGDATTLVQILKLKEAVDKLRLDPHPTAPQMNNCFQNDVVPGPTVLVFRMPEFRETMKKYTFYESLPQGSFGFEWKVKVTQQENGFTFHLKLVKGTPGQYLVSFGKDPERVLACELDTLVELGTCDDIVEEENIVEVSISIQYSETYAERCEQQQEYIRQLEATNLENESILRYLAEWQSKARSSTC